MSTVITFKFFYILMYVPYVLYGLLSRPKIAQCIHINNILYTISTPASFSATASPSGSPNLVLC